MSIEIQVPSLPESVADATLLNWHIKPGDNVNKDQCLVELETDKVILEVPAPADGVISQISKEDGATVVSGELLAVLDQQTSNIAIKTETDNVSLSPAVRRLIQENNLDPSHISGSGKGGRLTKTDVQDFLDKKQAGNNTSNVTPISQASVTIDKPVSNQNEEQDKLRRLSEERPEQRVPMTRLRARTAERLLQAQQNSAMLTTFNEVDMQSVMELRNKYKERFQKQHNIKLGFMSFFVKASIEALKHFPIINASIDDKDIIYHGYYDIGIAVSTERGLIVPIIRDAEQLDFAGIEKSIADFGVKAKGGSLSYEDLSGGTFTITNGGIFGSMLSTPILNPPQSAILGMHSIKERCVVHNGEIVVRPIMYLALSYDHQIVDGKDAVQFLATIKECLESPAHLLLNI